MKITKKESLKNVEYKKYEKSVQLRHQSAFSGLPVSGKFIFSAVLCAFCCILSALSFSFLLSFGLGGKML